MKKSFLKNSSLYVPPIVVGCMRISQLSHEDLSSHLQFCLEYGLNFFDHADIYGHGQCETKFSAALKETSFQRSECIIQSKCGIVPGIMHNNSKEYILHSVDGILQRLNTDYLDILCLHRPDALVEPEEVAEAFDFLESSGKVRYFGVSNHRPSQIRLLKKYVRQNIIVNQIQYSIPCSHMVANGLESNMYTDGAIDRDGDVLNYCRLHDITIQAWSPFQYGFFSGPYIGNTRDFKSLNDVLNQLAEKYNVSPTAIATAWILRHPAHMQIIAGTTRQSRMLEIMDGCNIDLTREEWYKIYLNSSHILP